ncbi:MAG: twin transmembrane helix small protein [Pseudomonadota bacterium]|nr:twin transmembrane helix small protein [Pseudomonadota bacterium]
MLQTILQIALVIALGLTVLSLVAGVFTMGRNVDGARTRSNVLMRYRVGCQLLTVVLFAAWLLAERIG